MSFRNNLCYTISLVAVVVVSMLLVNLSHTDAKDYKKDHPSKGNLCIARFESTTGEPLYYTCPRPNESEKKSYCCYLDKCCDYKEFQKQTEQQFKAAQNIGYARNLSLGGPLKFLLWVIFVIILLIIGCFCAVFFFCKGTKKLFQGGIFSTPLPAQPPGPSPYAPPTNPYMAYQWPPETAPAPPPAYPTPSYPPYPQASSGPVGGATAPPYNPNFK